MSADDYLDAITDHLCPRCHEIGKLLVNMREIKEGSDEDGWVEDPESDEDDWVENLESEDGECIEDLESEDGEWVEEPDRDENGCLRYMCLNPSCRVIFSVDDNDNITLIVPPVQMDIFAINGGQVTKKSIRWNEEQGVIITEKHFNEDPDSSNSSISKVERLIIITGKHLDKDPED